MIKGRLFIGPANGAPPASDGDPALAVALTKLLPGRFPNLETARRYCLNIWYPKSNRWIYQLNAKSGNSFTLGLLFELEFGVPFTAQMQSGTNQHPDFALFQLCRAGLCSNIAQHALSAAQFEALPGLRLATVRNPFARAVSSFRYFCRSHELGDERFVVDRLRIMALGGFDWTAHSDTPTGFLIFLRYIRALQEEGTPDLIDAHWLPQAQHIEPFLYRPELIGKTEDMEAFARQVAERLETSLPLGMTDRLARNEAEAEPTHDRVAGFYRDPAAKRLVRLIYEEDFDRFEYSEKLSSKTH